MPEYLAPGVYVEEIPSALQPITGVGTNTVGFVGVVPDEIEYPVANEFYDPTIADRIAKAIADRKERVAQLQKLQGQPAPAASATPSGAPPGTTAAGAEVTKAATAVQDLSDELKRAQDELNKLGGPEGELQNVELTIMEAQEVIDDANSRLSENPGDDEQKKLKKKIKESQSAIDKANADRDVINAQIDQKKAQAALVDELVKRKADAEARLADAKEKLSQEGLSQQDADAAKQQQKDALKSIDDVSGQLKEANDLYDKLVTDAKDRTKPYVLRKFVLNADEFDTKFCTNFTEYKDRFGSFSAYDEEEVDLPLYPGHQALTHAVYGFFMNGGTRCFVARVKNEADIPKALEAFESIEAIAIIAVPGQSDDAVAQAMYAHCDICGDRFAVLDSPMQVPEGVDELDIRLLDYNNGTSVLPQRNKNAALYFPWIEVIDPAKQLQDQDPARGIDRKYRGRVFVPPSGHVAGIYASTDEQRGVHKAPANAPVVGALNVKYYIGKQKQEMLNPQGVNVIRNINGNITVWGARTMGGDRNAEWKYINVRRLFLYLRDSIDQGTQWIVFEPNDQTLWAKIRLNVGNFLRIVWRSGALFGATPEEAYYVKCDAELNPAEVRDLGQVVTEIGVAIVRPAEFVIFRITQSTGPKTS